MANLRAVTSRPLFRIASGIILLVLLVHIGLRVHAFVGLFFQHAGFNLTQEQVAQYHNSSDTRSPFIPKIVHQIYHNWTVPENTDIPEDWVDNRQHCIDLNPGWEFKVWDIFQSRDFIKDNYPWFLHTYDHYPFPVQKIDALRYFLLRHYGGIYLDFDNGCSANLEPLRYYPAWTTDGGCGALSNNILASEPNHPYFVLLSDSLIPYSWNYILPYITISYASGQWYGTEIWEKYHATLPPEDPGLLRLEMDGREGAAEWVFFSQERGGTWNNWDNDFFYWIGDHLVILVFSILGLVFAFSVGPYLLVRCIRAGLARRNGYQPVVFRG